jgi:hypothetical protein
MGEAFRLGGWGMYPTLFVGIVLLISAFRFAASPLRGRLATIVGLGVLTMLTSTLGFVTGVIRTLLAANEIDPKEPGHVVIVGIGESLHNMGLGLMVLVIATIATVVGLSRRGAKDSSAVSAVDPHKP